MNPQLQRELLSYDEHIMLAKLEATKAAGRVAELEYQKSRFLLDCFVAETKAQEKEAMKGAPA